MEGPHTRQGVFTISTQAVEAGPGQKLGKSSKFLVLTEM